MGTHMHPNYLVVWIWLMVLAVVSVLASQLAIPASIATLIVYGAAMAKAAIVALYFMHLKKERVLIVSLVAIHLALFVILFVTLIPDFVFV